MIQGFSKRLCDVVASLLGLTVVSPIFILVAAAIRLTMGSPVFFHQSRIGLRETKFTIYKFTTMTLERDAGGQLLPDELRLKRLGSFLRRASLDELPQLWNVLKGDMSLVGPRPLLPEYIPRYSAYQRRRHEVKPGITGWAQVNGRNNLVWERKFELDVWYVDHRTPLLDLRILWMTVLRLIRGDGIARPGYATTPEFMGTSETGNKPGSGT